MRVKYGTPGELDNTRNSVRLDDLVKKEHILTGLQDGFPPGTNPFVKPHIPDQVSPDEIRPQEMLHDLPRGSGRPFFRNLPWQVTNWFRFLHTPLYATASEWDIVGNNMFPHFQETSGRNGIAVQKIDIVLRIEVHHRESEISRFGGGKKGDDGYFHLGSRGEREDFRVGGSRLKNDIYGIIADFDILKESEETGYVFSEEIPFRFDGGKDDVQFFHDST
jgi:hypothetical protein